MPTRTRSILVVGLPAIALALATGPLLQLCEPRPLIELPHPMKLTWLSSDRALGWSVRGSVYLVDVRRQRVTRDARWSEEVADLAARTGGEPVLHASPDGRWVLAEFGMTRVLMTADGRPRFEYLVDFQFAHSGGFAPLWLGDSSGWLQPYRPAGPGAIEFVPVANSYEPIVLPGSLSLGLSDAAAVQRMHGPITIWRAGSGGRLSITTAVVDTPHMPLSVGRMSIPGCDDIDAILPTQAGKRACVVSYGRPRQSLADKVAAWIGAIAGISYTQGEQTQVWLCEAGRNPRLLRQRPRTYEDYHAPPPTLDPQGSAGYVVENCGLYRIPLD